MGTTKRQITGLTATAAAVLTLSLPMVAAEAAQPSVRVHVDRKSTRLNSSHT